jgi:hypothetical protein
MMESRFSPFSLLTAEIYTTAVSVSVPHEKTVMLPDTDAAFENNCCIQIT